MRYEADYTCRCRASETSLNKEDDVCILSNETEDDGGENDDSSPAEGSNWNC